MQFLLRAVLSVSLLLSSSLSSSADEAFPVRDIRKVVVSGDDSVPSMVLKRAGERLKRSAKATRRAVAIERAAMEVRVSGVTQGGNGYSSARVTVTLSDLDGGAASRETLTVNSFMPQSKGRAAALGDAIAKRVAIVYRLAPTTTGNAFYGKRSGKGRKHAGGKRRAAASVHARSGARKRPLVIPSEAALTVRSRALPEGSKKKVAPCVVTQTITCD